MRSATSHSPSHKWWSFTAIVMGIFTQVVDLATVSIALPTIADYFDADLPTTQWIVIGYHLTISALLMPLGRLADIVGLKQVYLGGFAIFVICAALVGSADSILALIIFRVLQGVGSAMTQGTSLAMLAAVFPGSERGRAIGGMLSIVSVAAITGPMLGGFLISTLSWRWVFFIHVPAGLLSIATALMFLRSSDFHGEGPRSRFDWPGATLSIGILIAVLMALSNGPQLGWSSPPIIGALIAAALLALAFVRLEVRSPSPMLDLRLFKRRAFSAQVLASSMSFVGSMAIVFLMPFYIQAVLGYSPGQMGLIMVPGSLVVVLLAPLSGRLSDRYGKRGFMVGGLLIASAGLFLLSRLTVHSSLAMVIGGMVVLRGGAGIFESPNLSSIMSTVTQERYGIVSALVNLVRNASNITSIAIGTAIVTATMASMGYPPSLGAVAGADAGEDALRAFTDGMRTAFAVLTFSLLIGAAASLVKGRPEIPEIASPAPSPQAAGASED